MSFKQEHVESMEKVGVYKGEDVFHVRSKGGYNLIMLKKASGRLEPIGAGGHRAIAKHMADLKCSGIEWDHEVLYKSESDIPSTDESQPEHHMALADHHAKLHNKYRKMSESPSTHADEINSYYRSFHPEHKDLHEFNLRHDISMHSLGHEDVALKHYQMAGLTRPQAYERMKSQVDHSMPLGAKAPFSEDRLSRAWNLKNKDKAMPRGLKSNWAE